MKVVHLNAYDGNGGAGRACQRLNKALKDSSVDSEVWVNYKFGSESTIFSFNSHWIAKGLTAFGILLERFVSSFFTKRLKIPFSIPVWGNNLSKQKVLKDADIIHLHWINHAFLRPRDLARLGELKKPIVWTFHDSNAFTGGCHVRYSCDHYINECGNCPLLKTSNDTDVSHRIWKAKEKAYNSLDISIVAPSSWMKSSVANSKLLKDHPIELIPNTLDTAIFKPYDKSLAKEKLGLNRDKFIMLSGFMPSRKDLHKGTPYLLEALMILVKQKGIKSDNIELVVFGNRDEQNVPEFPIKTTFLGTISNDDKLALCYSAADVFLTPSLEDNLPNTVMESLSCGTPVVSFTTGGIPDMVTHHVNGYLAKYKSAADFANGIDWVFEHPDPKTLSEDSRKTVEEKFSEKVIAEAHIQFYKSRIEGYKAKLNER